jgi:hypothetical protein
VPRPIVCLLLCACAPTALDGVPATRSVRAGDLILTAAQHSQLLGESASGEAVSDLLAVSNIRDLQWPGGVVPVAFSRDMADPLKKRIFFDACREWSTAANVRCFERSTELYPYLLVDTVDENDDGKSCSAGYGVADRHSAQVMHLPRDCWTHPIILHELGHVLGFVHEHQRGDPQADRDRFVEIRAQHALPQYAFAFEKYGNPFARGVGLSMYDFLSIMHYPRDAFSSDGADTIEPRSGYEAFAPLIGHQSRLSSDDRAGAAARYGGPTGTLHSLRVALSGGLGTVAVRLAASETLLSGPNPKDVSVTLYEGTEAVIVVDGPLGGQAAWSTDCGGPGAHDEEKPAGQPIRSQLTLDRDRACAVVLTVAGNLRLEVAAADGATGRVTINGAYDKPSAAPPSFDWGDGTESSGRFPQSHVYLDRARGYTVTARVTYADGVKDEASAAVAFPPPGGK